MEKGLWYLGSITHKKYFLKGEGYFAQHLTALLIRQWKRGEMCLDAEWDLYSIQHFSSSCRSADHFQKAKTNRRQYIVVDVPCICYVQAGLL